MDDMGGAKTFILPGSLNSTYVFNTRGNWKATTRKSTLNNVYATGADLFKKRHRADFQGLNRR